LSLAFLESKGVVVVRKEIRVVKRKKDETIQKTLRKRKEKKTTKTKP
tara:strand:+ start:510 stop:650 length:141 start_codon:yes stop_codon:yes gene_type:complete